jgi:hypothetical protein
MKTTMIYTLPKWYTEKTFPKTDCCINMSDITIEDIQGIFESVHKLEEWIIENVWDEEINNYDAIGKRLAFLLDLKEKNFRTYRPMSVEKEFIYELQNEHPEIYNAYRKYENLF